MTRAELQTMLSGFTGSTFEYPFNFTARVYKIGGKMFALTDDLAEPVSVTLKCAPDIAEELREQHPGVVVPGYHMNKRHWNTVTLHDSVEDDDMRDWLAHSYDLVFHSLPRSQREEIAQSNRDKQTSH